MQGYNTYKLVNKEPVQCEFMDECIEAMKIENRRIGLEWGVSTVFLGMKMYCGRMFESLTIDSDGRDVIQRYETYAEAEAGHKRLVEEAKIRYAMEQAKLREEFS